MSINLVTELIFAGDTEQLKNVLKTEELNINECDSEGYAPLHAAVISDNLEALDLLLGQPNVDMNVVNEDNKTCIFMAILYNRDINIIKRLIDMGSDVNICNSEHSSTPLHLTVISSHTDIAELLIKCGANINAVDYCGFTPLHEAVLYNNLEMVQLLLFYGADTSIKCDNLCTPFKAAIHHSYHAIASELIEYECDFNDTTCYAGSILSISLSTNNPLTEEIIDRGADVNLVNWDRSIALEYTLCKNTARLFKKIWPLIDKNLLLNHCDKPFLYSYIFFCRFLKKEWTECLYELLSSEIAFELVDNCVVWAETENDFSCLFECVINAFVRKKVEKCDRIAIIYILLTLDMPTFQSDILDIYNYYGYNEELEALLFTNVRTFPTPDEINKNTLLATFIVDYTVKINSVIIEFLKKDVPDEDLPTFLKCFTRVLDFCTPIKTIKDVYYNKLLQISSVEESYTSNLVKDLHNTIVYKFNNMQEIPTLLELSRNAARTFVYNNTTKKNSCYYQTFLKELEIPEILKDIIKFKQCLYKVQ